jgi:hypothetical protein
MTNAKFRIKNGLEILEVADDSGTLTLLDGEVISDSTLTIFPKATSGTDTAGNDMIIQGGAGTGTGNGGDIIFKVADSSGASSGSSANSHGTTALTINEVGTATFGARVIVPNDSGFGSVGDQSAISIASTGIVTFNDNIRLPNAATIGPAGDNDAITLNIGTTVFTATTSSTSTTTGAVTVAGGLGLAGDAHFGGDLSLKHDSAVLYFGDGEDVLLTHVADVGLQLSTSATSGAVPIFEIYQDETDANGGVLRFKKEAGNTETADNDKLGVIQFFGDDDGGNSTNMGTIEGRIADASNADELGRLMLRPRADSGSAGGVIIDGLTIEGILDKKHALRASIGGNYTSDSTYTLTESGSGSVINMFQYPSDNTDNSSQHYGTDGSTPQVIYDVVPILNIGGGSTPHSFPGTGQGSSESDYYPNLMVNGTGYSEARVRQVTAQGESNTHAGLGAAMVIETVDKHNFNGLFFSTDSTNNTAFAWNTTDPSSTLGSDETWGVGRQVGAEGLFQIGYFADGYDDVAISTTKNPLRSANRLMSIHKFGGVGIDGVAATTSAGLIIGAGSQTYSSNTNRTHNIQLNGSGGIGPLGVYVNNGSGYASGSASAITVDDNSGGSPTLTGITSGKKLYDVDGNLIGQVSSASGTTITISANNGTALADDEQLYGMLGGVIYFEPSQATPSVTAGKLYNKNGNIHWNGVDLTAAGASALNSLTDVNLTTPAEGAVLVNSGGTFIDALIAGTANEVEVTNAAGAITIGLPDDVTITGDLTLGGNDIKASNGTTAITVNTSGGATVAQNLVVTGDLTVSGATTQQDVATLTVEDPLIELARNNSADTIDIGFVGKYNDGSNDLYAGLFRDANDSGIFKLFKDTQEDLTSATTVNTGNTGYTGATLDLGTLSINTSGTQDAIITSGSAAITAITDGTSGTIDSFSVSSYPATKYLILVEDEDSNEFMSTEILALGHSTDFAELTQYALLYSDTELGTFSVANSSGTISLTYAANTAGTNSNGHKVRVVATRIATIA